MVQNILALSVVFAALGYLLYSLLRKPAQGNQSKCGSCSGCSGCELRNSIKNKSGGKALKCH
ncbi:FeoB-associated Cys-rich membrane protein [Bacteroides sedimenti]|uniref:FeoB-associated Cys-rich membrane protein n=1 Tax=Bacteroides sedimenti TaxID=2136147 RepID=UPI00333E5212